MMHKAALIIHIYQNKLMYNIYSVTKRISIANKVRNFYPPLTILITIKYNANIPVIFTKYLITLSIK